MSITFPVRSPSSGASHVALLLLTVEIAIAALIHAPAVPVVSTNMLLLGLWVVFVATIILCRMPLPAPIRAALIMGLFALILSVAAKSDPFRLAATGNAFTASTTDRDRLAAAPGIAHVDDARPAIGRRVVLNGDGSDALAARLDSHIGQSAAGDLAIDAEVTAFRDHGGGYSVAWSVGRQGRNIPCGRLTLFTSRFDDSIAQMTRSFEAALDQSTRSDRLSCY